MRNAAALCASPRGLGGPRAPVRVGGGVEAGLSPVSCSGDSDFLAPGRGREVLGALGGCRGLGG